MKNKAQALLLMVVFICAKDAGNGYEQVKDLKTNSGTPVAENKSEHPSESRSPSAKPNPALKPKPAQPVKAGTVRLDAIAIPAGFMSGKGKPEDFISLGAGAEECRTGGECTKVTYKVGGNWGAIFWWPLSCGGVGTSEVWKEVMAGTCGIDVLQASGLKAVNKLTFWAKGQRGKEIVEFKVGAQDIHPKPGRSLGKVSLTLDWKQYEIDLKGLNLSRAVGLFAWAATDEANKEGAVFYLDDIQFEGK